MKTIASILIFLGWVCFAGFALTMAEARNWNHADTMIAGMCVYYFFEISIGSIIRIWRQK